VYIIGVGELLYDVSFQSVKTLIRSVQQRLISCFFPGFREPESKYTCCGTLDQGCTVASGHVFEPNESRRAGFMSTLSKAEEEPGIYALDCEMCYTTGGLELTRVTVVKPDLSVAYETLVKPKNKIIDYNTRLVSHDKYCIMQMCKVEFPRFVFKHS